MKVKVHFDGAVDRLNDGLHKIGMGAFVEFESGRTVGLAWSKAQGTNNDAEYLAALDTLSWLSLEAKEQCSVMEVEVIGDSMLVIEHVNRRWSCNAPNLRNKLMAIWRVMETFKSVTFAHVRREFNKEADRLSKIGLGRNNEQPESAE